MSQRTKTIDLLKDYFDEKGGIPTVREYRKAQDTPVRLEQVKRIFGSWARMENIVRKFYDAHEERPAATDIEQVIAERNRLAAEHEALMKAVGEDQEQKAAREAAARKQLEDDALRAATPEGAYENKLRKGGPEDLDAKVKEESLQRAIATEHAMLAKTPGGAALGKELLGGVEDQDEKNLAIADQNARTVRSALLAATPEGAAVAMMEEDDSDGRLTREAEARVRNELRPFVAPAKNEDIDEVFAAERDKVRDEVKPVLDALKSDENLSLGAAERAKLARAEEGVSNIVKGPAPDNAPPATQEPDLAFVDLSDELEENGLVRDDTKDNDDEEEVPTSGKKVTPSAANVDETVNNDSGENEKNPSAPPATRNPDPKLAVAKPAEKADKK